MIIRKISPDPGELHFVCCCSSPDLSDFRPFQSVQIRERPDLILNICK